MENKKRKYSKQISSVDDTKYNEFTIMPREIFKLIIDYLSEEKKWEVRIVCKYWYQNIKVDISFQYYKPFLSACVKGCLNIVNIYLQDTSLNTDSYHISIGYNGFILACKYNQDEIVKQFLASRKIDPSHDNNTAICKASLYGCNAVFLTLFKDDRINAYDEKNYALIGACIKGSLQIASILLINCDRESTYSCNYSKAFLNACYGGHIDIIKLFLNKSMYVINNDAFIIASKKGYSDIIRELLKYNGSDPSTRGNSAIFMACRCGHIDAVKELLKDSRPNPTINSFSIEEQTISLNYSPICYVDDVVISAHYSALAIACANGFLNIVNVLLEDPRVDPSACDNHALSMAVEHGKLDIIKSLKNHQKFDNSTFNMYPIMELAIRRNDIEILKELLNDKVPDIIRIKYAIMNSGRQTRDILINAFKDVI